MRVDLEWGLDIYILLNYIKWWKLNGIGYLWRKVLVFWLYIFFDIIKLVDVKILYLFFIVIYIVY